MRSARRPAASAAARPAGRITRRAGSHAAINPIAPPPPRHAKNALLSQTRSRTSSSPFSPVQRRSSAASCSISGCRPTSRSRARPAHHPRGAAVRGRRDVDQFGPSGSGIVGAGDLSAPEVCANRRTHGSSSEPLRGIALRNERANLRRALRNGDRALRSGDREDRVSENASNVPYPPQRTGVSVYSQLAVALPKL